MTFKKKIPDVYDPLTYVFRVDVRNQTFVDC